MAKQDWKALQQQFLSEHNKTGITPKEWCEVQGLNYATAKRHIKIANNSQKKKGDKTPNNRNKQSSKSELRTLDALKPDIANCETANDGFDINAYGLNDTQKRFVEEFLIDRNRSAAYIRAGGKSSPGNSTYVQASRMYRHPKVSEALRDAMDARARRTQITQDAVLQWWWDIATADAGKLSKHVRGACRYCWGENHHFHWKDTVEYDEACEKAAQAKKPEPSDAGGYGYDQSLDPNPECPRCNGSGIGRTIFSDTRDLTGAERRLFAGVKEGKLGMEILMRNQDEAMKLVAQHLGMLKQKTEISGPNGAPVEIASMTREEFKQARKEMLDDDDC